MDHLELGGPLDMVYSKGNGYVMILHPLCFCLLGLIVRVLGNVMFDAPPAHRWVCVLIAWQMLGLSACEIFWCTPAGLNLFEKPCPWFCDDLEHNNSIIDNSHLIYNNNLISK